MENVTCNLPRLTVSAALFLVASSMGALRAQPPTIAFASDRTGRNQIWTVVPTTTPVGPLTTAGAGSQESNEPTWSPSLGLIANQFGASGVRGIHTVTAASPYVDTRLTFQGGDERDPSWSPDGKFIAYSYKAATSSDYDIWIHDVAQATDYPLLARPANLDFRPRWSPDGSTIAFVTVISGHAEIALQGVQLVAGQVSITPQTFRILTTTTFATATNFDPTWSPDSQSLAFSTTLTGGHDIYVVDISVGESSAMQLTTNAANDTEPAWSPDGSTIVFVSDRVTALNPSGKTQLYALPARTPESAGNVPVVISDGTANDSYPVWVSFSYLGIDISRSALNPNPGFWSEMKQQGVSVVVVQAWGGRTQSPYAQVQLQGAEAANLNVAAYVLLNYDDTPGARSQVQQGIAAIGSEIRNLKFIAIDVEPVDTAPIPNGLLDFAHRNQYILDAIDEVEKAGIRAVIYSRETNGDWTNLTGRTTLFSAIGIPLWARQGDKVADLGRFLPFGGWTTLLGKQYDAGPSGLGTTCTSQNIDCDLDVFGPSLFQGTTPAGANVTVRPVDPNSGTTPVAVTFASATGQGTTSLRVGRTGPTAPSGFTLGSPPSYFDIVTNVSFGGNVGICIDYTGIQFANQQSVRLFHMESGVWVDRTISVDVNTKTVCASVSSLSPFAIFEPGTSVQVTVPSVVSLTQVAAETAITAAGLVLNIVTTAASSTVAAGNVISETPAAGTQVSAGSAVNLVVSTGPAQVAVPNVVGLTQAAATTAITGAGLVLGTVTTAASSTVAAGNVISESPVAGTQVSVGSAVNLVVSTGPAAVILTWANPADILYGSALGATQLNATANTPGTFVYTPPAGAVLSIGDGQTLRVDFNPTDTVHFVPAFKTVVINVKPVTVSGPANLVVTAQLSRDSNTNEVIVNLTVANSGGTTAAAVRLTAVSIGATSTTTALPISLGGIVAGGQVGTTVRLPGSVGAAGARVVLSVAGSFTGSSFGGNFRTSLP